MNTASHTAIVKSEAKRLGFDYCGISKAEFLEEEAPRLENWLKQKMHGEMSYMENHFDMRLDPTKLVPGAKSVISLLLNYYTEEKQIDPQAPKISQYAYGEDYHLVIKRKLKELLDTLQEKIGRSIGGRAFVDSAPVLDKAWAKKSGLGWIGKHTNLINKNSGSFFFIAELILDIELQPDSATGDFCGTCTRCIDACPTDAIVSPYVVDGSKCISYFTIELKDAIPETEKGKFQNWMFGCDICQDVCPWNRFSSPHREPAFAATPGLLSKTKKEWEEITEEVFRELFRRSAVKRTKFEGLKRNIRFLRPA
ncbi:MAG TPA: tRNA epoxyqueuosine(34) reductase QueG, partial [Bacteroidia bacterium]|nr:tRNA epoxyqueuosine(34) reductase QueG [Bacteroidia bacterium]